MPVELTQTYGESRAKAVGGVEQNRILPMKSGTLALQEKHARILSAQDGQGTQDG